MIHPRHIHALHLMVHIHAHVHHAQHWTFAPLGNRRGSTLARRKRSARVATSIHRFGKDGVGIVFGRNQYVQGLGDCQTKLVGINRCHRHAVRLNDLHGQSGNSHIEVASGRRVDKAQANLLARAKDSSPIFPRRQAVHQVGVGRPGDIRNIRTIHSHAPPTQTIRESAPKAHILGLVKEVCDGASLKIVIATVGF